ncbi:MAG: hypothetical protein JXR60_10990 [Bacteroidales bacterium]|nr:hypothetical protein [Bacteroidales bacterium]
MKHLLLLIAAVAFLSACNSNQEQTNNAEAEVQEVQYPLIALKDFQSEAANFLGKEIQTEGIVDHVCKHGGKKILLVQDDVSLHVFNEDRFDEAMTGKLVKVVGLVKEDRTDEAALLKIEEDAINSHSEGEEAEMKQERMINYVNTMRDSLKNSGLDHFSEYYLQFVSYEEVKE